LLKVFPCEKPDEQELAKLRALAGTTERTVSVVPHVDVPLPVDLQELALQWPSLPEAVKAGFIATAKVIGKIASPQLHFPAGPAAAHSSTPVPLTSTGALGFKTMAKALSGSE
jgi:hypothetical protein